MSWRIRTAVISKTVRKSLLGSVTGTTSAGLGVKDYTAWIIVLSTHLQIVMLCLHARTVPSLWLGMPG